MTLRESQALFYGDAGLHFLLTLPRYSEGELVERAAAQSVRVHPLSRHVHHPARPVQSLEGGYGSGGVAEFAVVVVLNEKTPRLGENAPCSPRLCPPSPARPSPGGTRGCTSQ